MNYRKRCTIKIYFSGLGGTMGKIIEANRSDHIAQEIVVKIQYHNAVRDIRPTY